MKPLTFIRAFLGDRLVFLMLCGLASIGTVQLANANEPRIVNLYNFVRNSDSRMPHSEEVLYETTRRQIQLIKQANLPATWALQYDALINTNYQNLFKEQLGTNDEIAAWWEIPRQLVEKAGLKWRGRVDWDWGANVGFSPGYTPAERRRLVDVYMADFQAIFGYYPRTAGSWFIDEVTLAYMAERYGIVASCNCKIRLAQMVTRYGAAIGTKPTILAASIPICRHRPRQDRLMCRSFECLAAIPFINTAPQIVRAHV